MQNTNSSWSMWESSGSSSDAQIFNRSDSREKTEDRRLGLLTPEPLNHRKNNCKQQDLQRQEDGGKHIWDVSEQF